MIQLCRYTMQPQSCIMCNGYCKGQKNCSYLQHNFKVGRMKKRYFNMIPSPDTACILLYGEIGGFDGISDKDIVAELYEYASMYKSIDIRVNSPGGSVYAGMSIFNALRSSEADITIYVDGIAASMASVIALCGKPVYMSQYARLMLHAPYGGCYGNKEELRSVSDELASLEDTLADMYASRLGKTREEIKDTYFDGKDHWITAKEAKEMGLVDGIYDIKEKVDAQSPQDIYAVFQARLNSQSFNTHNNMYEELRKRPSFAACATDEDVVRMLASMENKAGQYDAVVKERNDLKASLDGYVQKEKEARELEIKNLLESAMQKGRIAPASRDAYKAILEKDFENGKKIIESLPEKKSVEDVLDASAQNKESSWNEKWNDIQKKNGFK